MIGTTYSSKLQCAFHGWRVIADGEIALDLPDGNCCDMGGAIEIAEKIMPSVWRIATFSGGEPDTEYRLWQGKWQAIDMRSNDQHEGPEASAACRRSLSMRQFGGTDHGGQDA